MLARNISSEVVKSDFVDDNFISKEIPRDNAFTLNIRFSLYLFIQTKQQTLLVKLILISNQISGYVGDN
jgi:hypothetical protein